MGIKDKIQNMAESKIKSSLNGILSGSSDDNSGGLGNIFGEAETDKDTDLFSADKES